ncbi:MAG: hypothetical protein QWI36_02460 [Wolbachia endosymbiont of Tyrophagus putrescentiae]|nr:hypothetical protein [Wolbachia endosymbiont of Tyrophagus putrescentiae]
MSSTLIMNDYKPDNIAITSQNDDSLEDLIGNDTISVNGFSLQEIANFIQNKVINEDGLTLAEVFQVLLQMLNGNLELLRKVLLHAKIMVQNGMEIPKESQLTRSDVRRALKGKGAVKQDLVKTPPILPNVKSLVKKSRGV